mgnify:CR=1 FL=1
MGYIVFDITSSLLIRGHNIRFLTQARAGNVLCGVMYDYIRLEAPATSETMKNERNFSTSESANAKIKSLFCAITKH